MKMAHKIQGIGMGIRTVVRLGRRWMLLPLLQLNENEDAVLDAVQCDLR